MLQFGGEYEYNFNTKFRSHNLTNTPTWLASPVHYLMYLMLNSTMPYLHVISMKSKDHLTRFDSSIEKLGNLVFTVSLIDLG